MTSGFETLFYEKRSGIAYVTLNRPHVLNAYNIRMRDELSEIIDAVRDDPEVAVVVFMGAGDRAFCAGADLSEFLTAPSPTAARRARWQRDTWGGLLSIVQPLIGVLHGYVLGVGLEIALCCDLRIAADDSKFGFPEASLGIIPAGGGTQTLPRIVGRGRALDMIITGRIVDAQEALAIGLVTRVVSAGHLRECADSIAMQIASLSPDVAKCAKEAVRRGSHLSLADGLQLETMLAERLMSLHTKPIRRSRALDDASAGG